jgi:hypothetical protein
MSARINSWCGWDPLEEVWVGQHYSEEYWSDIKNKKIADPMKRISVEMEEDYQNLIKILKDFGVKKILRPTIDKDIKFGYHSKTESYATNPRDHHFVYGDTLYRFEDKKYYNELYKEYKQNGEKVYDPYTDSHTDIKSDQLPAPSVVRFGDAIIVDTLSAEHHKWFKKTFFDTKIFTSIFGGHSDGCFCPVNSKLIVTLQDYKQNFRNTIFKNFEFLWLPNESWDKVKPVHSKMREMIKKTRNRWYIEGEHDNPELIHFVDTWLSDWVGYCAESVFDVNMLVLDEHNVIVNSYNKTIFDTFKKYNIEPTICNLRHRYFWDGGLHCNTLDIRRKGNKERYLNY